MYKITQDAVDNKEEEEEEEEVQQRKRHDTGKRHVLNTTIVISTIQQL